MNFIESNEFQNKNNKIFDQLCIKLIAAIPKARIEHIGASAISGAISKGDLDIYLSVPTDEFEKSLQVLLQMGMKIKEGTLRTPHLCMVECFEYEIDVAIQLIDESNDEIQFLTFRNALTADSQLLGQYNELKQKCQGMDANEYRRIKSEFVKSVLRDLNRPFQIETERLLIRDYETEDWERVHIYGSQADFSKYELWGPNSVDTTKKFIADMVRQTQTFPRYKFDMAICLRDSGFLIGGCGIRKETESSAVGNLGWAINPEFQNKGYATEAARALIDFGFQKLQLNIIYATCDSRNQASYKVMEKAGMTRVGFIRGTTEIKGFPRSSYRYEIKR